MREITYAEAINEAVKQLMEEDSRVFLIGQGSTSPWYLGNTTAGLLDKFGEERIIDTPVSEASMTGAAAGAALAGSRPILVHPRMDWMHLAMEQIINQISNWHYMFGQPVPLTIRAVINKGRDQGAQHSQATQAMFAHIPGLKVVMPATPYDAKGLLVAAVRDGNPVLYIEDRWLYNETGEVPEEIFSVPIGKGEIKREGKDLTVAAVSCMTVEALKAADELEKENISCEVIDLKSIKPLDEEILINSVKKTGRLIVADTGWETYGISAEVAKRIYAKLYKELKSAIEIVALPDSPAPASPTLEKAYYPDKNNIIKAAKKLLKLS